MTFSLPGHIALQEWSSEEKPTVFGLKDELQELANKKAVNFVKI